MSDSNNLHATVLGPGKHSRVIARIVLNGHNIKAGGPLGYSGAMRSFKLLEGNLWDPWDTQQAVIIRTELGQEARVRIAALPAEKDSAGFVEFV